MTLRDIPYISPTDLTVFKIMSCGLRTEVHERRVDANDAWSLLNNEVTLDAVRDSLERIHKASGHRNLEDWTGRPGSDFEHEVNRIQRGRSELERMVGYEDRGLLLSGIIAEHSSRT